MLHVTVLTRPFHCWLWLFSTACFLTLPIQAETRSLAAGNGQFEGLPQEFEAHFFDVPLAVRVELDGRYLGDALVVISRDDHVQLLEFTETQDSKEPASVRGLWQARLADGRVLGACMGDCPDGLQAIHYSLANSQLSLLTANAEKREQDLRYYTLPEQSSAGMLLRNQLNLVNDGSDTTGRIGLLGQGSLGNWTTLADAQIDRTRDDQGAVRYRVDQLYTERLHDASFFRLGFFTPAAQGLVRQPTLLGSRPHSTLGLMYGSSDSLLVDNGQASSVPVYVTANRPGVAEIYRNGSLINSQQVQPGLQTLDTRVLPGGVYEVEVRLLEDGLETSRSQASIYKPTRWRNLDNRWRYNLYVGQESDLLSNWDTTRKTSLSAGGMANYLLHPTAVLGFSTQHVEGAMQYGTSMDWDIRDRLKLYGNLNHTQDRGNGYDLQLTHNHAQGSVLFSHNQSWLETRSNTRGQASQTQMRSQTSLSVNQRVTARSSATLRLERSTGAASGLGIDLGWAFYGKLKGHQSNVRVSVFDRPGTRSSGNVRSRGVNVSVSMSLERDRAGQLVGADFGSRASREGGNDPYASLWYQRDVEWGPVNSLGGSATYDSYGSGFSGNARFKSQSLLGDAYAQSSTYDNNLSTGLNLETTLGMGAGKLAVSGQDVRYEAGLIIDVDTDVEGLVLSADDDQGGNVTLRPGRNIVPATPLKAGNVRFDFDGKHVPAAQIQPASVDYHLNRGGMAYHQLHVLRTVTVLGRLLDGQGQPMRGARVVNVAGRTVAEADGYFTVEMSESRPSLEIHQAGTFICQLTLTPDRLPREGDVLLVGDQRCAEQAGSSTAQNLGPSDDNRG